MKKLEQNEYYEALNRFVSEAGLNGDDKKEYCQYFTVGGCLATSLKTCKNCKFFCPTTPKKLEIVACHALKLEALNDKVMMENEGLQEKNRELRNEIIALKKDIELMTSRIDKLNDRALILRYLKPAEFGKYIRLSILKKAKPVKVKEESRHLSKKLMKEWDEIRILINPNARR